MIRTTVTGPGTLALGWEASSEKDHDFFKFIMDWVIYSQMSGEVN